ncbi:MAG: ligase-associated DNA damage response exonuclease [Cyclobacteriaceae bacterium]
MSELIRFTERGIYCEAGDFYIDPWKPVDKAIITHAHSDHARWGSKQYLAHHDSREVLKLRLGEDINLQTIGYDEQISVNGVKIAMFPAGHIFGSAQIRIEHKGEVWVASGDYKTESDGFTVDFEPVKCHTFITESTFGLPVFNWQPQHEVMSDINQWWKDNQVAGKTSIICAYALGKAQRVMSAIDASIGKIYLHGAVANVNEALIRNGAILPEATRVTNEINKEDYIGNLIVTPLSGLGTSWVNKFSPYETAMVSGWMNIRGMKRRRAVQRGFVLSDHADWKGLNEAIAATGAERVFVTHGYQSVFARYLGELGYDAQEVITEYEGERLVEETA